MTAKRQRLIEEKLEKKAAEESSERKAAESRKTVLAAIPILYENLKESIRECSKGSKGVLEVSEGFSYQDKWHEHFVVVNAIDARKLYLSDFSNGMSIWASCNKTKTNDYDPPYSWDMYFDGRIDNGEVTLSLRSKDDHSNKSLTASKAAELILERLLS
jgi:hypothetical protein